MIQFNNVKIFTDTADKETLEQVHVLDDSGIFGDAPIRIMPDCHKGAGCTIGFTAPILDKITPNLVGVDIGCGMLCIEFGKIDIDLAEFDKLVHKYVPAGKNISRFSPNAEKIVKRFRCIDELKEISYLCASAGSLGGGNHFIELDVDEDDNKYLIIHTGSRNLGKQVAEIYQRKAIRACKSTTAPELIEKLKSEGRDQEIEAALQELKKEEPKLPRELCYVQGEDFENYMLDMKLCIDFANFNRQCIAENILQAFYGKKIPLDNLTHFTTLHNYIGGGYIRKGAISAKEGERVLIPLNMRDGCIIGIGKGNPDWNYSAPHGAGRVLSRSKAKQSVKLEDYQNSMQGIYTTTVNMETIDESPFAYKPSDEIIELVKDTITIEKIIKPIYNFKAGEEDDWRTINFRKKAAKRKGKGLREF